MSTIGERPLLGEPPAGTYLEVQRSPEFVALRRRLRRFVFPMSALFLLWYGSYVLVADYTHGFMDIRIGGSNVTVGLVFGLLQFVSTFLIATLYVRFANRNLDPEAARIRAEVEGGVR